MDLPPDLRILRHHGTSLKMMHVSGKTMSRRRAWIAEIRKDAEKEYEMGSDVDREVFESFVNSLDQVRD